MIPIIEVFEQVDAITADLWSARWPHRLNQELEQPKLGLLLILRIVALQSFQDPYLDLAGISILLYRANDLDRDLPPCLDMSRLDHLSKCSLTQESDDLICKMIESAVNATVSTEQRDRQRTATYICWRSRHLVG